MKKNPFNITIVNVFAAYNLSVWFKNCVGGETIVVRKFVFNILMVDIDLAMHSRIMMGFIAQFNDIILYKILCYCSYYSNRQQDSLNVVIIIVKSELKTLAIFIFHFRSFIIHLLLLYSLMLTSNTSKFVRLRMRE